MGLAGATPGLSRHVRIEGAVVTRFQEIRSLRRKNDQPVTLCGCEPLTVSTTSSGRHVWVLHTEVGCGMRYLMLMWSDADATGGDEGDLQAWIDFDEQVKAAGAFVLNGALTPAASEARLVQTAIAGHDIDGAVQQRP